MRISRRTFLKSTGQTAVFGSLLSFNLFCGSEKRKRPNILWLSCEDTGPHLGCFGDANAVTPHLDRLAEEGVLFTHAYTVAGVCAPNRSSIITGMYASTLGTHNMRSGGEGIARSSTPSLPVSARCFTEYLKDAGYFCTNNYKEDYNFVTSESAWNESSRNAHWKNRREGQPFFAVFNYTGSHEGSHRLSDEAFAERTKRLTAGQRQDRRRLSLPPYYPDTPVTREVWARYYELVTALDYWVADRLREIEDAGLAEETIVFFWADHGVGLPRAKRWVYDSGTHIPLIVRIPETFRAGKQGIPGTRDDRLVSSLDFSPTVLGMAGLPVPESMQGRYFLEKRTARERRYVFGIRDRMDERYDTIRTVRDTRFRYIRNFHCHKPYTQFMQSAERGPIMRAIREQQRDGTLPEAAGSFMAPAKPPEELYDTVSDPHELYNLAEDPAYEETRKRMRTVLRDWMLETRDLGLMPEPELVRMEKERGSRGVILDRPDAEAYLSRLHETAVLAGRPQDEDLETLVASLEDEDASVRYWAMIGIGQWVRRHPEVIDRVRAALDEEYTVVRIAAAEAMWKAGFEADALSVLKEELGSEHEWMRLHAAICLDEMGEAARPAIPELRKAMDDEENKYVVRVANHALNALLGTNHTVR